MLEDSNLNHVGVSVRCAWIRYSSGYGCTLVQLVVLLLEAFMQELDISHAFGDKLFRGVLIDLHITFGGSDALTKQSSVGEASMQVEESCFVTLAVIF